MHTVFNCKAIENMAVDMAVGSKQYITSSEMELCTIVGKQHVTSQPGQ